VAYLSASQTVVAMRQKDSGDSSMFLEKILETPEVARRIDE
jgi:hypothetical protein